TFVGAQDPRKIIEVFGLSDVDFRETTGQNGYASALRYGHISFNYAGRADMGVNVDISGQGCRELEQLKSVSWQ
ncbi:hypothetical protein CHH91_19415, partial [Virgibacillus sp. 7505]|uniref:hypothetical protein n=1 Tax=Virgibacillus sp. 7505 TaxID=2022548 RepID=UPI000BD1D5FF